MTLLLLVILGHPWPWLIGYWTGALMHLIFDVMVNGEHATKRVVMFYMFTYRAMNRFSAQRLLEQPVYAITESHPVRDFFRFRPAEAVLRALRPKETKAPVASVAPTADSVTEER
jgi:hypothetical protein